MPTRSAATRKHSAACVALIGINIGASLAIAVALVSADILPGAMAFHAAGMVVAWGCLLPLGGLAARYFKVTPAQRFPAVVDNPFWWNWHRGLQYAGVALATVAVAVMLRETNGRVDTLHGRCGLGLMVLAWLQLASPLFRGSKGGPTERGARPEDHGTWRGDHYDMTTRRRLFEAWHKTVGWCLLILAQGTILLGVDLAGAPDWIFGFVALMMTAVGLAILDSHLRGRWVDTHAALWGPATAPSMGPDAESPPHA